MNAVQEMEALAGEWYCGVERKGKGHVPYIAHPRAEVTDSSMEHVRMGANSSFFGLFLRNTLQPVP